ncbi:eukaryotic translation initiation factor 4E [Actinidia rufa]|uniref:mRNA cap-binding protein n=1 Tax=Actinidia rufa TaxID=165716 RepID=A0A7J0FPG0_9ERIC|nr:eukaryotic translation initiation factor 4E [Actinidia rufa]
MDILYWLHHSCLARLPYISQSISLRSCTTLDPPDTPALALRTSVQRLLPLSILLTNTTGPMSDSSSPCLDTPFQSSAAESALTWRTHGSHLAHHLLSPRVRAWQAPPSAWLNLLGAWARVRARGCACRRVGPPPIYNNIHRPSNLEVGTDFYCFKDKIVPKWEDPVCAKGGNWSMSFLKGKSDTSWLYTLLAMIGEQFDHGDEICGAIVNARAKDKISIWTKNAANETAQVSIGKQWKKFLDYNDNIGFIFHDDALKLDKELESSAKATVTEVENRLIRDQPGSQSADTRAEQTKEAQTEWVMNDRMEDKSTNGTGIVASPNKFKFLEDIPESEEQIQLPESSSRHTHSNPIQHQTHEGGELSANHNIPDPEDQLQIAESNLGQNNNSTNQKISQVGGGVYIQQAEKLASGEIQNLIKQNQKGPTVRGLNKPLKQNGILSHVRKNKIVIMGILETKLKNQRMIEIVNKEFRCWQAADNLSHSPNGRILIIWKSDKVNLDILESNAQVIQCLATCISTSRKFYISFVYAFNTVVSRRPLWDNLCKFSSSIELPWLLLGDFNNVLKGEVRANGIPVTLYEMKDFQDCCYEMGITDLRYTVLFYTWSNNSVWSKLDRAMVNTKWIQEGWSRRWTALADFGLPGKCSYHSPCIVSFLDSSDHGGRPFKFFNMWTQHTEFLGLVRNAWELQVEGTAMFRLCRKLKCLKDPLKRLNEHHFSHISARAEVSEDELLQNQQLLHDNPSDESLQIKVADLRKKASRLAEAELSFCSQLAKVKYLKNCDRGTKFFHNLIKSNKARNQIVSLSNADGVTTTSPQQVSSLFVEYYKNLLGTRKDCQKLDNGILAEGDDKAPGPDGYSSCFFKKSWDITGTDVCLAVKEFFRAGFILKQLNHATIVLVPKSENATRVEDFRPISCCNVVYKTIFKILALRLSPILKKLIDPAQSAFVPNRSMMENIYMVQELMRKYSWSRVSPRNVALTPPRDWSPMISSKCLSPNPLDRGKTSPWNLANLSPLSSPEPLSEYSSVGPSRPSSIQGLVPRRLSNIDCWLLTLDFYHNRSSPPCLSGNLHGFFKGKQGLRQGDPLSPFLFAICLEVLSRSLSRLSRNPQFKPHPKCSDLFITHLAFADDLNLFARGDATSVGLSMDCLKKFGECSGLCINASKSNVFMAGISQEGMEEIKAITGFSLGEFPFRYLVGVRDRVVSLCRNFLWGGKATVSKKSLVAWKEVCRPKHEGGLGFIDLSAWNLDLMSKALWNLLSKKDSLWVKWINHIYTKDTPFWEYVPKKEDSQIVRFLAQIRDKIMEVKGSSQAALGRLTLWAGTDSFNVKACYEFFRDSGGKPCWTKVVWHSSLMPKRSFILWLSLKERLLTRDKLTEHIEDTSCVLCDIPVESLDHLFFQCSIARECLIMAYDLNLLGCWPADGGGGGLFVAEFVDPVDAVDAGADAEESFVGSELRVAVFEGVILGCLSPSSQGPVVADDADTADAVDGLLLLSHSPPSLGVMAAVAVADLAFGIVADG